jgi:hypothetical protein
LLLPVKSFQKSIREVKVMKRITTVLGIAALALAVAIPVFALGPGGYGGYGRGSMMGYSGGGPGYCGGYGGGYGRSYGPPGPGYGYGSDLRSRQGGQALGEQDVRSMLGDYLSSTGNPNLKLGAINEKESAFEAEILTKDGSLVDRIAVDKTTGRMGSVY